VLQHMPTRTSAELIEVGHNFTFPLSAAAG